MRLMRVLVLVAACGGSSSKPATTTTAPAEPPPDPIPATAGPDCQLVADKLAIVTLVDQPAAQPARAAELRTRCSTDGWSDEARSCFASVEADDEVAGCTQLLTAAQRAAVPALAGTAPTAAPAPTGGAPVPEPTPKTKKPRNTRGPIRDSADPCEGGEASADPCEGGENK